VCFPAQQNTELKLLENERTRTRGISRTSNAARCNLCCCDDTKVHCLLNANTGFSSWACPWPSYVVFPFCKPRTLTLSSALRISVPYVRRRDATSSSSKSGRWRQSRGTTWFCVTADEDTAAAKRGRGPVKIWWRPRCVMKSGVKSCDDHVMFSRYLFAYGTTSSPVMVGVSWRKNKGGSSLAKAITGLKGSHHAREHSLLTRVGNRVAGSQALWVESDS